MSHSGQGAKVLANAADVVMDGGVWVGLYEWNRSSATALQYNGGSCVVEYKQGRED